MLAAFVGKILYRRLNKMKLVFKKTLVHTKNELFSAPCSAGDYMTDSGCQQCGENTFSEDGASSCTSCSDGTVSAAGSTSEDDCGYGISSSFSNSLME